MCFLLPWWQHQLLIADLKPILHPTGKLKPCMGSHPGWLTGPSLRTPQKPNIEDDRDAVSLFPDDNMEQSCLQISRIIIYRKKRRPVFFKPFSLRRVVGREHHFGSNLRWRSWLLAQPQLVLSLTALQGLGGDGGGYGAGSVEKESLWHCNPCSNHLFALHFPTGQCYASANLPWASVSGTAVAQVFSLSVRGKTGILRWWCDCLNLLPTHSCPIQSTDSPLSASTTGVLLFLCLEQMKGWAVICPREEFNSAKAFSSPIPASY